jgi:hypothetical protein
LAVLFALVPAGLAHGQECPAKTLDAGPLKLEVHVSGRTATLFHVVDQVSGWSEFCHRQYAEDFESRDGGFSPRDRELLARHATVRQAHGWGAGLEQTFYTPSDLETALKSGVAAGSLTAEEAAVEREVLLHFAPRVDALRERQAAVVRAFAERLVAERANLREFAQKVSRFCGGSTVTVPVYLLADPSQHGCGGGFNGGRLTWEVPGQSDVYYTFLHEVFHAFLEPHRAQFDEAAGRVPGLDFMTLNEGMAYALSPGLLHASAGSDPLLNEVLRDLSRNKPLTDNYTRFHRLGLALRPLLRDALDDKQQTLTTFLPRAADAWRVAVELDRTNARAAESRKAEPGSWFSAGPAWRKLTQVAASRGHGLSSFNHSADHYRIILARSQPGSMVVLLFALDHPDKNVPEEYQDLLPMPWSQIEAALQRGETLEIVGEARQRRIVLLAAPTESQLNELIPKTKLLSPKDVEAKPKAGKRPPAGAKQMIADSKYPAVFIFYSRDVRHSSGILAKTLYPQLTHHLTGRHHSLKDYEEQFTQRAKPGDTIVLLLLVNEKDLIPAEFQDLLPKSWPELVAEAGRQGAVRHDGESRQMHVVLLLGKTRGT